MILTMRRHDASEWILALDKLAEHFKWGKRDLAPKAMVNLTHHDFLPYGGSKGRYLQDLYLHISNINIDMSHHNVPHFLVMFENDFDKHLDEIHLKFRELSGAGLFKNPVVPILVDLLEPEVFDRRAGIDWRASSLQTNEKRARVQIYWGPGNIEYSNNLALVFERTLGLKPEEAMALFQKYENPYLCRNLMAGKNQYSCVMGECMTPRVLRGKK